MQGREADLIYLTILLVLVGSAVIVRLVKKPKSSVINLFIWVIIIGAIIAIYSVKDEFAVLKNNMVAELFPSRAIIASDGSVQFKMSESGHFYIDSLVNHQKIQFLLDTGASDVALSLGDAKKIGINTDNLQYTKIYNTANGQVFGAPIIIRRLKVGEIELRNVRGSVNQGLEGKSLLGMSFLNMLSGYEVQGDTLVLWE